MKKQILLFLIVFSVFLLGCSGGGFSNPFGSASSAKPAEINFYTGTQGVIAEFSKNAPPQSSMQDSSFPILIRVRNLGAYDVKKGIISLGMEKDYAKILTADPNPRLGIFNKNENAIPFELDGKSQTNKKGDEVYVSLNAQTGKLDPQSETHQSTVTATLCYPYQTTASATICIDSDPAGIRPGNKVCKVQDISFSSGQGAPIAVTKIESQMVPREDNKINPQFLIYVENRGGGDAVNPDSYENACSSSAPAALSSGNANKNIWNSAFIEVYNSAGQGENQLICCPNINSECKENTVDKRGFLKFKDKKDFVRCTFSEGKDRNIDAYTSPLKIVVKYGYVQSIAANFEIKKPLKY